ncbi:MAG: hypothetical protein NZ893_02935, partial [Candidatus Aenigmarchaeota archaeon]|nr:hypothetical protein [Candidatus Aenigmarchaeota archaeon]
KNSMDKKSMEFIKKIRETKSLPEIKKLSVFLYGHGKKMFNKEDLSLIWEILKERKSKLLAYKELARKKILRAYLDAREKCLKGTGTIQRINEWSGKLPVSEETREFVKKSLREALPPHLRGE